MNKRNRSSHGFFRHEWVTGYDHLLFLVGVIFFLYRMKEVAIYVTLFKAEISFPIMAIMKSFTNLDHIGKNNFLRERSRQTQSLHLY
jgi:hypothetical protein